MLIGILGDVHSNLEALTAAVEAMRKDGVEHWVQVGDIVGYGPDPEPCIDLIRELGCTVCMGNHDAAVVDVLDTDYFNRFAKAAIDWTRSRISADRLAYLRSLPYFVERPDLDYTVVHGSLHLPEHFGYVLSQVEAEQSMRHQRTLITFVGHSHVPAVYVLRDGTDFDRLEVHYESEGQLSTRGAQHVLANVGSVGQPRDEDPRAAYALFDGSAGTVTIRRVPYDIATTQAKIRAAGLPEVLAERLGLGV